MKKLALLTTIFLLFVTLGSRLVSSQTVTTIVIADRADATDSKFKTWIENFLNVRFGGSIKVQYIARSNSEYRAKVQLNILNGNGVPDIFVLSDYTLPEHFPTQDLVSSGNVLPLDDLVSGYDFIKSLHQAYTFDGHLYGIVKSFDIFILFYNKLLFNKAGRKYPDQKNTWDDFKDNLVQLKNALGKGYWGACLQANYMYFAELLYSTGWTPETFNVLDPRFKRAFYFYIKLFKEAPYVAPQPSEISADNSYQCLAARKSAIAFETKDVIEYFRNKVKDLRYGVNPLPRDPKTKNRGSIVYSEAWAINKNTKNFDAAVRVFKLLTSVEAQESMLEYGLGIPSRKYFGNTNSFPAFKRTQPFPDRDIAAQAYKIVYDTAFFGNVVASNQDPDFIKTVDDALQSAARGQYDEETALARAQAEIDKIPKPKKK
jgi:multiple sugar transport system substrate-binding protein